MKNLLKEKNKHSLFPPVDGSRDQRMAQSLHLSLTSGKTITRFLKGIVTLTTAWYHSGLRKSCSSSNNIINITTNHILVTISILKKINKGWVLSKDPGGLSHEIAWTGQTFWLWSPLWGWVAGVLEIWFWSHRRSLLLSTSASECYSIKPSEEYLPIPHCMERTHGTDVKIKRR